MRVNNDIGNDAGRGLWHILRIENHTQCPLLPMPRGELVANLGNAILAHTYLGEGISLAISIAKDAIHPTNLVIAHCATYITEPLCAGRCHLTRRHTQRNHLAN